MRDWSSRHPLISIGRRRAASLITAIVIAASVAPGALAAEPLTVTTLYPAVVASPGGKVSFEITITTTSPARVGLAVSGIPAGWTAKLYGGGYLVDAVETDGKNPASVRLDVTVPADATGTTHLHVTGTDAARTVDLPLDVRIEAESGDVTLQTNFPSLKGSASATFSFNLTLTNQTAQDLTFAINAQGPDGWTVDANLTGQAQAASAIVKAGGTSGISVSAKPPSGIAAGQYPITVIATAGAKEIEQDLQVEVTGSYTLTMSTPDLVLNNHGSAGGPTEQQLTITNTGTADITNVKLSASAPTNWVVDFDPQSIDSLAPDQSMTVTSHITPSADAIAGDYQVTYHASGDQASASTDIRFTVETSLVWALLGGALIVAVFVGLWWVFRRYGRR